MHFRFLNIPVYIQPTFWIFLLLVTNLYRDISMESMIVGIVFTLSLLIHEYGHALTALYFGASPAIVLEAFGGRAEYNGLRMTPRQHFLVTLNGPLLESVLIVLSYAFLKWNVFEGHPYIQYFLYVTMRLNILWCLLNLIPVAPLDGGHLARYLLERKWGESGTRASVILGLIFAAAAVPYLCYQGFVFFGILLGIFGFQHFQLLRELKPSEGTPFSLYMRGVEAMKENNLESAKALLKKLLKTKDRHVQHLAIESLAKVYVQEKEDQKSYELLLSADPEHLKQGKGLLCKLAFQRKNYTLVEKYSREIYDIDPSYETAALNSKAFAGLNQPVFAGAWLETASHFSEGNVEKLLQDPIYDAVKKDASFQQYVYKINIFNAKN
ncbi:MAG: site-2 protease family protein [Verrucomicrobia bacterium]|nr:site-2 protease family protein [Verrucomicrobiota bacterium]